MQPRVLFVSNLWDSSHGSTSMDCHYPLRNWVHRVANLQCETDAAAYAGRRLTDAGRDARKSIRGHCFGAARS